MTPNEEPRTSRPRQRRAILAAGLGAAAATAVAALERATPTRAADGDFLKLGNLNTAASQTSLSSSSVNALFVEDTNTTSGSAAISATAGGGSGRTYGLSGGSPSTGGIGVFGIASSGSGETTGVEGRVNSPDGFAVNARSLGGGVALRADGAIRYSWSGKATILAGKASRKVTHGGVASQSLVFAVLANSRSSRWVRAVVPSAGYFTIYLNGTVGKDTKVSWFILDWWR